MSNVSDWLNPRRRRNLEYLIEFLRWNGRKVSMDEDKYAEWADGWQSLRLDRYAVDQAADDGYALGVIDIHLAGDRMVLTLLSGDVDRLASPPPRKPAQKPAPVFALSRGRRP